MPGKQHKRYWLRSLIGFDLDTLSEHDTLEEATQAFNNAADFLTKEKRNVPYMLFLVDAEEDKVIKELTKTPTDPDQWGIHGA